MFPFCVYGVCGVLFGCFSCQYRCNWLPGKTRLWNDLLCVYWDVKPYTLTHSLFLSARWWLGSGYIPHWLAVSESFLYYHYWCYSVIALAPLGLYVLISLLLLDRSRGRCGIYSHRFDRGLDDKIWSGLYWVPCRNNSLNRFWYIFYCWLTRLSQQWFTCPPICSDGQFAREENGLIRYKIWFISPITTLHDMMPSYKYVNFSKFKRTIKH